MALLLAGCMLLLPFLRGNTQTPPATFEGEWLAVLIGTLAALVLALHRGTRAGRLPLEAASLIAFSAFLAIQFVVLERPYFQMPLLGGFYAVYAALMLWLGSTLAGSAGLERVTRVFAWFLLAGALLNSAAGIIQIYGRPPFLENWVLPPRGGRALGNVGQSNLYANYLTLGGIALAYLWLRGEMSLRWVAAAAVILIAAAGLSGTRAAIIFLLWLALLGFIASRRLAGLDEKQASRLMFASCAAGVAAIAAHLLVPITSHWLTSAGTSPGAIDRIMALGTYAEPRWQAWLVAGLIFFQHPALGVGFGQFPYWAFQSGLDPDLPGFIWTSPHNLILHLLAECGVIGAALALTSLVTWWKRIVRSYSTAPSIALWFLMALVGVETLHSMLEFPLWNAQFLGATALLMGAAIPPTETMRQPTRRSRVIVLIMLTALSIGLASLLHDYIKFDQARITGTKTTLATPAEKSRAIQTMLDLSDGLLGPLAEGWMLLGTVMDKEQLPEKLALSERVIHYWPGSDMLARRAALLGLAGEAQRASEVLALAARAFPQRCQVMELPLRQALQVDSAAIAPLLLQLRSSTQNCL